MALGGDKAMGMHFIGIDVGTGSARAGVFDAQGALLGTGKADIAMHRPGGDIAEQSSARRSGADVDADQIPVHQRHSRPI